MYLCTWMRAALYLIPPYSREIVNNNYHTVSKQHLKNLNSNILNDVLISS